MQGNDNNGVVMGEVGVGTQWFAEKEKEGSTSEGINTCFFLSLFH
jgi:hypothetical protein